MNGTIKGTSDELAREIREKTGTDIRACYQCGKCSAGCPIAPYADVGPRRIMHLVQLGDRDRVLRTGGIWLCVGCEACSTRCPREVGPSHVIDALRQISLEEGFYEEAPPSVETIPTFHEVFLESVRFGGRLWELFLVGAYKLRTLDFFSDTLLGTRMFFSRKLNLLPPKRIHTATALMKRIRQVRREEIDRREEELREKEEREKEQKKEAGSDT